MNVTRDIITDLLPVYLSGEASEDTRTLVESFFRQDPEFEELARAGVGKLSLLAEKHPTMNSEKETLMRIKRILRLRSILMGAALFCTLMPFAFAFGQEGITWLMVRDFPKMALQFGIGAVIAWGGYWWTFRALQDRN